MKVLTLMAKLGLDKSEFDSGLTEAQTSAGAFGTALGNGLKKAASVGAAAVGAATAAATGFAASAVEVGKGFDSSMSQVVATMGFSLDELNDKESEAYSVFDTLRNFAQEQGATTAFSAKQAADALNYMALAGYDAKTSMKMLPNVLNLASAGGLELATASDMVTDASSALGLSLDETEELIDKMARASSKSNTSVGQLGDAILTVGGTAKNLAGGTTELSAALGVLADNGVKGAEGGTALRNIILSLSAPTDTAAEALAALGVNAFDSEGNLRPLNETFGDMNKALGQLTQQGKTEALNKIFNKVDLKSVNALLANTTDEFAELYNSLDNYEVLEKEVSGLADPFGALGISVEDLRDSLREAGSAEQFAANMMDKYGMSSEQAMWTWDKFKDVPLEAGGHFQSLEGMIDDATGAAQDMAKVQLDNLQGDITLFQSALEGAKIAISDSLTPTLRDFTKFGSDSLSELTMAFQDGGLTGAMDALGGVITNGIAMITEKLPEMVDAGIQLLGALAEGIVSNLPAIGSAALEIFSNLFTTIQENLPTVVQNGIQMLQSLGQGIQENLPEFLATALNALVNFSGTIRENFGYIVDAGLELIGTLAQTLIDNIPLFVATVPTIISNFAGVINDNLPTVVQNGIQMLQSLGQGIQENLPEFLATALNALVNFSGTIRENFGYIVDAGLELIGTLAQTLIDNIPLFVATVPTIISNFAGVINDNLPKVIAKGIELIGALVTGIIDAIPAIWENLPKIVQAIFDVITAFNWVQLGSNLINWLVDGVKALFHALPDLLNSIGKTAVDVVKGIDWIGLGKTVIQTIADGIWQLTNRLPEILANIGGKAMEAFSSIDWWSLGSNVIAGIASGITSGLGSIVDAAKNAAKSALDAAKGWLGIKSPSRVFRDQVGKQMAAGMGIGFEDNVPTDDMVAGVSDALDEIAALDAPTLTADMTEVAPERPGMYGGNVINVYPSEGMDEQALAEKIDRVLTRKTRREEVAYA